MKEPTIRLVNACKAWGTPGFGDVLKAEIEQLPAERLPLQQGLARTSQVSDSGFSAIVISAAEQEGVIRAEAGILYAGIIAGCSCADDPTPVDELTEYCVVEFSIDRDSAETTMALVAD